MKYGEFETKDPQDKLQEPAGDMDPVIHISEEKNNDRANPGPVPAEEYSIWTDPFFADFFYQDAASTPVSTPEPSAVSEKMDASKAWPSDEMLNQDLGSTAPKREPAKEKTGDSDNKVKPKETPQQSVMMYLHDLVYLICGILLVLLLCFRVVVVSGDSMKNTLVDGDYLLLISNFFYHDPQQGDIIVASKDSFRDGEPIVKRVIATEGQTVDIDFEAGIVYVDGTALDEPYTYTATTEREGVSFPLTVEEGCVFVMGDYRNVSMDSRHPEIGLIDKREILGKAIFLLLPGTDKDRSPRYFYRIGVLA